MNEPSDRELIERYTAGEARAFDQLVERYERRVYAVALRMCGSAEDARDVSQEVFLNAMRALKRFREEAQLSTWFHRVAINASLDHHRKQKRRITRPIEEAAEQPTKEAGPEEVAAEAARAAEVHRALAQISPDHRAVLVLHDLQDLDYAEVAAVLDIPAGTVKSRIHRARVEMARLLGHLRETEPLEGQEPLKEGR
jgi:RNA polymerase sigma-70 factor (ECF subfamily)